LLSERPIAYSQLSNFINALIMYDKYAGIPMANGSSDVTHYLNVEDTAINENM